MIHTEIELGKVYRHRLDGKWWRVKVLRIFLDRSRWGFEGEVQQEDLRGAPCWGWCSELRLV